MTIDDRIHQSWIEAERSLGDLPPPPFVPRRRSGPLVTGLIVVASVAAATIAFAPLSGDPVAVSTTTSQPTTTATTSAPGAPVSAQSFDSVTTVLDLHRPDGTRLAVLMPTSLVEAGVTLKAQTDKSATLMSGATSIEITYDDCAPNLPQGVATMSANRWGADLAATRRGLLVCRADQFLVMTVDTGYPIDANQFGSFGVVPIEIGVDYAQLTQWNITNWARNPYGPLPIEQVTVTNGGRGTVVGWSTEPLAPLWHQNVGGESAILGEQAGLILVSDGFQSVTLLEAATGETKWTHRFPESNVLESAAPDPNNGVWYLAFDDPSEGATAPTQLVAISAEDGTVNWSTTGDPATHLQWVSPAVFDDVVVIMGGPNHLEPTNTPTSEPRTAHLIAFDINTGERKWSADLEDPERSYSGGLLASDPARRILIAANTSGVIFSIDPSTGDIRWRTATGSYQVIRAITQSTIELSRSTLYLATGEPLASN